MPPAAALRFRGPARLASACVLAAALLAGCGEREAENGEAARPGAQAPDGAGSGGAAEQPREGGPASEDARAGAEPGGPAGSDPPASAPGPGDWTVGIVDRPAASTQGVATLTRVETGRHPAFDRVVIEFEGGRPGLHAEYVDRPVRECGSGHPVPLPGDAWLEIRLEPARGHDDEGRMTIASRRLEPELPNLLEAVRTCDYEAHVNWVLAVRSPEPYRVLELRDPDRWVVDVRHR